MCINPVALGKCHRVKFFFKKLVTLGSGSGCVGGGGGGGGGGWGGGYYMILSLSVVQVASRMINSQLWISQSQNSFQTPDVQC